MSEVNEFTRNLVDKLKNFNKNLLPFIGKYWLAPKLDHKSERRNKSEIRLARRKFVLITGLGVASILFSSSMPRTTNISVQPLSSQEVIASPEITIRKQQHVVIDFLQNGVPEGYKYLVNRIRNNQFIEKLQALGLYDADIMNGARLAMKDSENPKKLASAVIAGMSEKHLTHLGDILHAFNPESSDSKFENSSLSVEDAIYDIKVSRLEDGTRSVDVTFNLEKYIVELGKLKKGDVVGMSMQIGTIIYPLYPASFIYDINARGVGYLGQTVEMDDKFMEAIGYRSNGNNSVVDVSVVKDDGTEEFKRRTDVITKSNEAATEAYANISANYKSRYYLFRLDGDDRILPADKIIDPLTLAYSKIGFDLDIKRNIIQLPDGDKFIIDRDKTTELSKRFGERKSVDAVFELDLQKVIGAYDEKNNPYAEKNLRDLINIAKFTDATLVVAGGNSHDNFGTIRAKLEKEGIWPSNLIIVGISATDLDLANKPGIRKNARGDIEPHCVTNAAFGPDIYVSVNYTNSDFPTTTSNATKAIEGMVLDQLARNPDMTASQLVESMKTNNVVIGLITSERPAEGVNIRMNVPVVYNPKYTK